MITSGVSLIAEWPTRSAKIRHFAEFELTWRRLWFHPQPRAMLAQIASVNLVENVHLYQTAVVRNNHQFRLSPKLCCEKSYLFAQTLHGRMQLSSAGLFAWIKNSARRISSVCPFESAIHRWLQFPGNLLLLTNQQAWLDDPTAKKCQDHCAPCESVRTEKEYHELEVEWPIRCTVPKGFDIAMPMKLKKKRPVDLVQD